MTQKIIQLSVIKPVLSTSLTFWGEQIMIFGVAYF